MIYKKYSVKVIATKNGKITDVAITINHEQKILKVAKSGRVFDGNKEIGRITREKTGWHNNQWSIILNKSEIMANRMPWQEWAQFESVDANGKVWQYELEPTPENSAWSVLVGFAECVGSVDPPKDYKKTLVSRLEIKQ